MRYPVTRIFTALVLNLLLVLLPVSSFADDSKALAYLCDKMSRYIKTDQPKLIEAYSDPYPPCSYDNYTGRSDLYSIAFLYDSALAACLFVEHGKAIEGFDEYTRKAKQICQGILWHLKHDPTGVRRLRDAYYADQDMATSKESLIPTEFSLRRSSLGSLSWAILALLRYHDDATDPDPAVKKDLLKSAVDIGEFIHASLYDSTRPGYFHNVDSNGTVARYKSTEQNITAYVAFMKLYEATKDPDWRTRAYYCRDLVQGVCWSEWIGIFYPGTDGNNFVSSGVYTLDANTIPLLALGKTQTYGHAPQSVYYMLRSIYDGIEGFDFGVNQDPHSGAYSPLPDGIWFEGMGQMACAYQLLGAYGDSSAGEYADLLLTYLDAAQNQAPNADGRSIVAASKDGLTTGYDYFYYYSSPHVASTVWYIAAQKKYNLLWGIITEYGMRIPYDTTGITAYTVDRGETFICESGLSIPGAGKLKYAVLDKYDGIKVKFDKKTGDIKISVAEDVSGEFLLTFLAIDKKTGVEARQQIVLNIPNSQPALSVIGAKSAKVKERFKFQLKATDSDKIDKDNLKFFAEGLPKGASLNKKDGTFKWRPATPGTYTVTFRVEDLTGSMDQEVVNITVI